jgi:hypothetical protein
MGEVRPLMYGQLAGWFHLLTPPEDYAEEAAEVLALLRSSATPPLHTALELGSGGGNLASHLHDELELTLTDTAPAMLELSRRINPGVEHLEGDMRELRLGRTFDAVIVHDAITYMAEEAQLQAAFETAWAHLRPGGAALFMPDWVLDTFEAETESGGHDEDGRGLRFLEWDGPVGPDGHTVQTDYIIVTRDGATTTVYHDTHELGIFPRATWLELLTAVGFEARRVDGDQGIDLFLATRPT